MATQQRSGKKSKPPDDRPARKRYWAGRHLERNKIRGLMKGRKMTRAEATAYWNKERKGRVPDKYLARKEF